jgi:hypothetical protein
MRLVAIMLSAVGTASRRVAWAKISPCAAWCTVALKPIAVVSPGM